MTGAVSGSLFWGIVAEKRMFSKSVIERDDFWNLTPEAQALYIHLNMFADDEGLINNVEGIKRLTGCSEESLDELIQTGYILPVLPKIFAVTHWNVNNSIPESRRKSSIIAEPERFLDKDDNGVYKPKGKIL